MSEALALRSTLERQRRREARRWRFLLAFIIVIGGCLILDIATGPSLLGLGDVVRTLLDNPLVSPFTLGLAAAAGLVELADREIHSFGHPHIRALRYLECTA